MATMHVVCSPYVQNHFPEVHKIFCSGECQRPQRHMYPNGKDFFEAMGEYLKQKGLRHETA